ncbi:hypothetical protein V8E36_007901 [Tilletia maclaganii]
MAHESEFGTGGAHILDEFDSAAEFTIRVTLRGGLSLGFVYLPPSIVPAELPKILQALEGCDVVSGDWNAMFGDLFGYGDSGPWSRLDVLIPWLSAHDLYVLHPKGDSRAPRLDHAVMRWDLRQQPSSSVQLLPFESTRGPLAHPSEHPTIHVELCTKALSARQDLAHDTTRPNLARLRDQKTRSAFRAAYAARSPGIEAALTLAEERARDARASPQNRQDAVDFADQLCHTELLDAAFASLGSYSAKNVRRKRDDEAARLEHAAANDTTAALRRWRRAQRGRARPLVSSEEGQAAGRTAEEDALWYWGGVWGSRMAAPTPPESVEECGIEDGEDGDSVALS